LGSIGSLSTFQGRVDETLGAAAVSVATPELDDAVVDVA
jgi:hypothetical protein